MNSRRLLEDRDLTEIIDEWEATESVQRTELAEAWAWALIKSFRRVRRWRAAAWLALAGNGGLLTALIVVIAKS